MKNLIISVLMGLVAALAYIGIMLVISAPFMLLIKMGLLGIVSGDSTVAAVVANLTGSLKGITGQIGKVAIAILVIQSVLFVVMSVVSFMFMTKVMGVYLKEDSYFRHLYDGVFLVVMIVPEVLIILSLFFGFSVTIAVYILLGLTGLVTTFSTIMAGKVLPDLMKNTNRRYLLNTGIKDK